MIRMVRLIVAIIVLAGGLFVGARPIGPAPALGSFLEPAHGVWSLSRAAAPAREASSSVPGLGASVRVMYDERAVPHIFARSEADAYRALGYVVARDRLFQLYVQTLGASGRVTEIGGAAALDLDREMRRLGLPRAAERQMAAAPDTSLTAQYTKAYADGVNAYIEAMPASELPLEMPRFANRIDALKNDHVEMMAEIRRIADLLDLRQSDIASIRLRALMVRLGLHEAAEMELLQRAYTEDIAPAD
jgi:penicillin amidase